MADEEMEILQRSTITMEDVASIQNDGPFECDLLTTYLADRLLSPSQCKIAWRLTAKWNVSHLTVSRS